MYRIIQHSKISIPRFSITATRSGHFFSTGPDKSTDPNGSGKTYKIEEAETIEVPPPPTEKISCVGGFGSNSQMYKINGTANINAIRAASEAGVKGFVYISAADFGLVNYLLQGYYEGKRAAETELFTRYPYGGVILRPGFIHGTRRVGSMKLPLSVIGSPLETVFQRTKALNQIPVVGPLLTPPVNVKAVTKVAVRAAIDPVFPPGIVDVHGIFRYSQQKR